MTQNSSVYIFTTLPLKDTSLEFEFIPDYFKFLPTIFSLLGISAVFIIYYLARKKSYFLYKKYLLIWHLFNKKLFTDGILNHFLGEKFTKACLDTTYILLDKGILERFGPAGLSDSIEKLVDSFEKIEYVTVIFKSLILICFFITAILCALLLGEFTIVFLLLLTILAIHFYLSKEKKLNNS